MAVKKLTEQQAKRCEEAREPVCHCRCGGKAHGAMRGGGNAPMAFYYGLPEDDPHYTPSPERRKQLQQEKQQAKRKERQDRIDAAWKEADALRNAMYTAQRDDEYERAQELQQQFLIAHARYEEMRKAK